MARERPVASLSLLKIEILLVPALVGLLGRLGARLRKLYAELPGQIQGRLDWFVEAAHGGPHVRDVAVEAASEAVSVIVVEVHGWVIVMVVGGRAAGLAGAVGGDDLV
jgi:hypothetical protein